MATTMTTNIGSLVWSSVIPELEFTTDAAELAVTVLAGAEVLLDIVQTPYNGKVTVWEVRHLVERHLELLHSATTVVTVQVLPAGGSLTTVASFTVVYCSKDTGSGVSAWCGLNFLTTARYKLLTAGLVDTLYVFAEGSGSTVELPVMYHMTTRDARGDVRVVDVAGTTLTAAAQSVVGVPMNLASLEGEVEDEVIGVAVRVGSRVMNYYRMELAPTAGFLFHNCFNVPELALIHCSTTAKVKDERKVASVARRSVVYNPTKTVSYEVHTSPLRLAQARWLEQLATSVLTWLSDGTPVVITESEVELSDDHAAANAVKFTWQRDDGRSVLEALRSENGIFQAPFTYQFD